MDNQQKPKVYYDGEFFTALKLYCFIHINSSQSDCNECRDSINSVKRYRRTIKQEYKD